MGLPSDVTGFTLTFGPYLDAEWNPVYVGTKGKIRPSVQLRHLATGAIVAAEIDVEFTIGADGTASVGPFPHTDQLTIDPQGFVYIVTFPTYKAAPPSKNIPVPAATGTTADYDTL